MNTYTERSAVITYQVIDHEDKGQSLPEANKAVNWWFKGMCCPPYVGTMLDDDFPGFDYFFCWSNIPSPPKDFFKKYNPEF